MKILQLENGCDFKNNQLDPTGLRLIDGDVNYLPSYDVCEIENIIYILRGFRANTITKPDFHICISIY